jgi:hypothetical protein
MLGLTWSFLLLPDIGFLWLSLACLTGNGLLIIIVAMTLEFPVADPWYTGTTGTNEVRVKRLG